MKSLARMFLITMSGIVLLSFSAFAGDKIGARLSKVLEVIGPNDEVVVWVYFTDKGSHEFAKSSVRFEMEVGWHGDKDVGYGLAGRPGHSPYND